MSHHKKMKQNSKKLIAKNVKKYREKLHLKKEELSLKAGFDNSYISKLEANKMNITIEKLDIIADILNIKTIKLLED